MNKKQWVYIWRKERDEVIRAVDVEKFKEFYHKWEKRGLYRIPCSADNVIEVALYKMLYNLKDATPEEMDKAEKWLKEHNSDTTL